RGPDRTPRPRTAGARTSGTWADLGRCAAGHPVGAGGGLRRRDPPDPPARPVPAHRLVGRRHPRAHGRRTAPGGRRTGRTPRAPRRVPRRTVARTPRPRGGRRTHGRTAHGG